jgi:hypothetical protein
MQIVFDFGAKNRLRLMFRERTVLDEQRPHWGVSELCHEALQWAAKALSQEMPSVAFLPVSDDKEPPEPPEPPKVPNPKGTRDTGIVLTVLGLVAFVGGGLYPLSQFAFTGCSNGDFCPILMGSIIGGIGIEGLTLMTIGIPLWYLGQRDLDARRGVVGRLNLSPAGLSVSF